MRIALGILVFATASTLLIGAGVGWFMFILAACCFAWIAPEYVR